MKVIAGTKETAVNAKALEAFIKVLYAATAALATDQVSRGLAQVVGGWANTARKVGTDLGIDVDAFVDAAKGTEIDDDEFLPHAKALRRAVNQVLKADTEVDHAELEMMRVLSSYMVSQNDNALKKAIKLLPQLGEQELIDSFILETKSQKEFVKPLEKIVFALTKERGRSVLTAEEVKLLKEKNPVVHREYLRLRRDFNQVWKDELRNLVFNSKKQAVDFKSAVKYLDQQGIQHSLPKPFDGLIDANGKLYTKAGKGIAGLPGPGFSIVMNPDYDPKADDSYVFTTVNDATGERSQHVYTESYKKKATQEKFDKVKQLDAVIDDVRRKWFQQLRKGNVQAPEVVASTVLELLYQFSARVGSMGNQAGGVNTFGISTLQVKHLKQQGKSLIITYQGKDNVRQIHKLDPVSQESKFLIKNIMTLSEGKDPKDRLFTFKGPKTGKELPMTGNLVNRYFQKLGSPVTVHKLRHVRGTRLFNELVKANEDKIFNNKKPLSEAQALKVFKQLASKVGGMLGHVRGVGAQQKVTPATAIANYISPASMVEFFTRLGQRPPKFLSRFKEE